MFQKLEVDRSVHLGNVFAVEVYRSDYIVRMGRKADALYINPKKFGSLTKPCMKEMVSFLNCLALNKAEGSFECLYGCSVYHE
ncbi:hypothetical protein V6N12_064855 [Hibiscus sabdariffa]|uniref:Uncharacterized protein n=1 Tax=Hibiscus sabdariffa TaxID=183260 RepID=A0ABR2G8F3_9ROSI